MTSSVPVGATFAPDSPLDWSDPLVPGKVVLDDRVAPNASWSAVVKAGHVLTIVDVGGNQSGDCLIYNAADTEERYSVPDTLAWQGNAYVRTGTVLRSNLGNPLMTVVGNEIDRQDTIGGACSKESNTLRYGHHVMFHHGCRE
ncbi:MAG TPA: urea carboxylase-associated family protein, partial [Lentzea sp.]